MDETYEVEEKEAAKKEVTDIDVLGDNGELLLSSLNFRKPYVFEGKEYKQIDLTGLESITGNDMIAVNKLMAKSGGFEFAPELTLEYACHIAAKATKLPVELFKNLPAKDAMRLKNRITAFLYGAD